MSNAIFGVFIFIYFILFFSFCLFEGMEWATQGQGSEEKAGMYKSIEKET